MGDSRKHCMKNTYIEVEHHQKTSCPYKISEYLLVDTSISMGFSFFGVNN